MSVYLAPPSDPSPNSYTKILIADVIAFEGKAFGRWLGPEGGTVTNGISALIQEVPQVPQSSLTPSILWRQMGIYEPRSEPSPDTEHARFHRLGHSSLRNQDKYMLLFTGIKEKTLLCVSPLLFTQNTPLLTLLVLHMGFSKQQTIRRYQLDAQQFNSILTLSEDSIRFHKLRIQFHKTAPATHTPTRHQS